VDFDLLGRCRSADTLEVARPSFYAELVWECRKQKAQQTRKPIDWIVMRNRMSPLDARNKQRVGEAFENLSRRVGFRIAPGLSERVIYRELFPMGLSLLDLTDAGSGVAFTMSHVAARQEIRDLMIVLKLPGPRRQRDQLLASGPPGAFRAMAATSPAPHGTRTNPSTLIALETQADPTCSQQHHFC
jgi:chromosome partitioning protein